MTNLEEDNDNNDIDNDNNSNKNPVPKPLTTSTCIQIIQEIYITIIIHGGIQLVPKDRSMFSRIKTTSDPFIRIILLNQLYGTTSIQYKTINPIWGTPGTTTNSTDTTTTTTSDTTTSGEQFIIQITNNKLIPQILRSSLLLTIWDYDRLTKHDKMGIVTIPISDIVMNLHSTTTVTLPSSSSKDGSKIRSSISKKIQQQQQQHAQNSQNSSQNNNFHRQLYNVETGKGTKYYCYNATGQLDVSIASTIVTIDPTVTTNSTTDNTVPKLLPMKSSNDNDSDSNSSDDEYINIKRSGDIVLPAALTRYTNTNVKQDQHQHPVFIPIGSTTDDDMDGRGSYCLSKIIRFVVSIDFDDTSSTCKINRQLLFTNYLDFVCVGLHRSTGEIIINNEIVNRDNICNSNQSIYILTQDDTDDNDNEILDANLIISCSLQQIPDDVYVLYFILFVRTTNDTDTNTDKQKQSIHTFQQLFETYNISRINIRAEQCMASSSTAAATSSSFLTNDSNDNDSYTSNSNNNTSSTANDDTVIYNELYVQSIQREDYPTSSTRKLSKLESIRKSILLVSSGLTSNCSTYYIGRLYRIDDTLTTTIAINKKSTTTTTTTTDSTTKTATATTATTININNITGTSTKITKTASTIAAIYNPLAHKTMSMMKKLNIHSTSTSKKKQQQQLSGAASSSSSSSLSSRNKDNDDNSTSTTSNNIDNIKYTTVSASSSKKSNEQQQQQVQYDWALDQMDCIHMTGTNCGTIQQDIKLYTKDIIPHIPTSSNKIFAVLQTMDRIRLYDYYYNNFTSNNDDHIISQPSVIINTISFAFQLKSIPYSSDAVIQQSSPPPIVVPLRNDLIEKSNDNNNSNNNTMRSNNTNSNTSCTISSRFPIVCISFDSTFQIIDRIHYKCRQSNDKSIRYSVEEVHRKKDNIYYNSSNNPILYSNKEVFDINISNTTHHNNDDNTAAVGSSTTTSAATEKVLPVVVPSTNKKELSKTVQYVCFIMINDNTTITTTPGASSSNTTQNHHDHQTSTNTYTNTISNISCTVFDETTLQTIATYSHNTQPQRIFGSSVGINYKNNKKNKAINPSAVLLGCFFLKQNSSTGPNSISKTTNSTNATTNEIDTADNVDVETSRSNNNIDNTTADWHFVALADECFQNFNANSITQDNVNEIQIILSKRNVT